MAFDGCMNFFAGPTDNQFSANINMYDVHYTSKHIVGPTGGNNDDLIEANTHMWVESTVSSMQP